MHYTWILSENILHLDIRPVALHEGLLDPLQVEYLVVLEAAVLVRQEGQGVVGLLGGLDVVEDVVDRYAQVGFTCGVQILGHLQSRDVKDRNDLKKKLEEIFQTELYYINIVDPFHFDLDRWIRGSVSGNNGSGFLCSTRIRIHIRVGSGSVSWFHALYILTLNTIPILVGARWT